jgi:hypothetical protein
MTATAAAPAIQYDDVQGTILRGYRVDFARHFVLTITHAAATGQLVTALVNGSNGLPKSPQRGGLYPSLSAF